MHKIALMTVVLVLGAAQFSPPALAAPAFWEKIFGKKNAEPDPTQTLQAPFYDPDAQTTPTANALKLTYDPGGLSERSGNLALPHRHDDQVAEWISEKISSSLNINSHSYKNHLNDMKVFADQFALANFDKFMRDTNILPRIDTGGYDLRGFVNDKPFLVNEGAAEGRYRWLFEIPVTLTFLPAGSSENAYAERANDPATYNLIITCQVGRVSGGDEGLIIENWSARSSTNK